MNPVRIRTVVNGTEHIVEEIRQRDLVEFERLFNRGAPALDDPEQQRMEWVQFLAWTALRRLGVAGIPEDREAFIDALDDIEVEVKEADERPIEEVGLGQGPRLAGAQ